MKFWICNEWEIDIPFERESHDNKGKLNTSYAEFLLRPRLRNQVGHSSTSHEASCRHLLASLPSPGIKTVVELFGGVGVTSTIVQEVIRPDRHFIGEFDPETAALLRQIMSGRDGVEVLEGDSTLLLGDTGVDTRLEAYFERPSEVLLYSDANSFSVMGLKKPSGKFQRALGGLVHKALSIGVGALVITDVAVNKLHMNRRAYSNLMGREIVTIGDYMLAFSEYLRDEYGYMITCCPHHHGAAYFACQPIRDDLPFEPPNVFKLNTPEAFRPVDDAQG